MPSPPHWHLNGGSFSSVVIPPQSRNFHHGGTRGWDNNGQWGLGESENWSPFWAVERVKCKARKECKLNLLHMPHHPPMIHCRQGNSGNSIPLLISKRAKDG